MSDPLPEATTPGVRGAHPTASRGRNMLLVGALICLAAFNSGNNIFFLVAATLFAMVLLSKWKGRRFLSALEVRAFAPVDGIFANRDGRVHLQAFCRRGPMEFRLHHPRLAAAALGFATPEGEGTSVSVRPPRRGAWRFEGLRATSVAPYGITAQRRAIRLEREVLVFPEPAADVDLRELLARQRSEAEPVAAPASGSGTDFLSLREYHPEDGIRRIHWRGLAKTGVLLSKVYEQDEQHVVAFHLDREIPEATPEWLARFELAVSRLTAAVLQAEEQRRTYAFSMTGLPALVGRGRTQRNRALGILAQVEPHVGASPRAVRLRSVPRLGALVFGAGGGGA